MDERRNRLIERVRKLLSLATHNSNENEAAAAAEKAAALLAEHNLVMAELHEPGADDRMEESWEDDRAGERWVGLIYDGVAHLNMVLALHGRPWRGGRTWIKVGRGQYQSGGDRPAHGHMHILIGTRANVEVTRLMAEYLVEAVERVAQADKSLRGVRAKNAFKFGCAMRLRQRLALKRAEATTPAAPDNKASVDSSHALARVYRSHHLANHEFYRDKYHRDVRGGRPPNIPADQASMMRGHGAADGIGLNSQVKRQRSPLALPKP